MAHRSLRITLTVFLLFVCVQVVRAWQAQSQAAAETGPAQVNIYEDTAGFVYANPYTIRTHGGGRSKIVFHSDTTNFVVAFDDGKVCGARLLQ